MLNKVRENPRPLLAGLLIGRILLRLAVFVSFGGIYYAVSMGDILDILPGILLLVHLFACYGKKRTQLLPPIALLCVALDSLIYIVQFGYLYNGVVLALIPNLVEALASIYLAADAFKGYKWRRISKWVIGAEIASAVLALIINILNQIRYGYAVSSIMTSASYLCWLPALLIFWQHASCLTADQARQSLIALNESYENHHITWDAYQKRKAALLRRL